jgi:hypothetical protein
MQMENNKYEGTGYLLVGIILGIVFTWGVMKYNQPQTKYKMNLKCIQGELYEEVRTNMFVKSHLECFEQKTLVP